LISLSMAMRNRFCSFLFNGASFESAHFKEDSCWAARDRLGLLGKIVA